MSSRAKYRPGPGWTRAGIAPVYDHDSGIRVHVLGSVRLNGGRWINGKRWPESRAMYRCIWICGGNRKRGVMAYARAMIEKQEATP